MEKKALVTGGLTKEEKEEILVREEMLAQENFIRVELERLRIMEENDHLPPCVLDRYL